MLSVHFFGLYSCQRTVNVGNTSLHFRLEVAAHFFTSECLQPVGLTHGSPLHVILLSSSSLTVDCLWHMAPHPLLFIPLANVETNAAYV